MELASFAGRRVLVTGASGAFGSATTDTLGRLGAAVVGLDVAGKGDVLACDVTDQSQVDTAVAEAVDRLGGLDAVVHFAGIGIPVDVGARPDDDVMRQVDVNLFGVWRVTAAALPELLRTRGRVVITASELAHVSTPFAGAYMVSKRGLTAYADALRCEYGTHLRVTCVHPGYVRTGIHEASETVGLSMEGTVRREKVADIVRTVLRVLAARRPPRETACTRLGRAEVWGARHRPAQADAVVRWQVRRLVDRGHFSSAPLASGLVERHGRGGGP